MCVYIYIILERLFLVILLNFLSIYPLSSGLSQKASSLYLVQRGLRNLGGFTLFLDGPTRELTQLVQLQLSPGRSPWPDGPQVEPREGSCFAPGSCHRGPCALAPAEHSRTEVLVSAAPPAPFLSQPLPPGEKEASSPTHIDLGEEEYSGHGQGQACLVAPAPGK